METFIEYVSPTWASSVHWPDNTYSGIQIGYGGGGQKWWGEGSKGTRSGKGGGEKGGSVCVCVCVCVCVFVYACACV